jgi:CubicO group peptidase (beta-lactamase class C family)
VPLDAVPEDHPMRKTFSAPPLTPETAEAANTIAWRRADIGGSNGHGNARSLARACFWGGWGGSAVVMNPDRRATFAYVMNKMGQGTTGTERTRKYGRLIYQALD